MTPNYPNRAEIELAHIRTAVAGLPTALRHRILNRCDKLSVLYRRQQAELPEADDRTPRQQQEQVAGQYNTAQRIVAALLSGRTLSQRDSQEFKTTAFHSRIADARRILSRQGYTLRSRYTTDAETLAGRAFKLYWIDNTQNI
jgi:hypothetical protein